MGWIDGGNGVTSVKLESLPLGKPETNAQSYKRMGIRFALERLLMEARISSDSSMEFDNRRFRKGAFYGANIENDHIWLPEQAYMESDHRHNVYFPKDAVGGPAVAFDWLSIDHLEMSPSMTSAKLLQKAFYEEASAGNNGGFSGLKKLLSGASWGGPSSEKDESATPDTRTVEEIMESQDLPILRATFDRYPRRLHAMQQDRVDSLEF